MKKCSKCALVLPFEKFAKCTKTVYQYVCKACAKEYRDLVQNKDHRRYLEKRWRKENPAKAMITAAKGRARKAGVPFSISAEDIMIPEYCPVLGNRLEKSEGVPTDNSPSLDKVIPALGYVKGNVRVISWRANRLKGDASLEELKLIVKYLKEHDSK